MVPNPKRCPMCECVNYVSTRQGKAAFSLLAICCLIVGKRTNRLLLATVTLPCLMAFVTGYAVESFSSGMGDVTS